MPPELQNLGAGQPFVIYMLYRVRPFFFLVIPV